MPAEALAQQVEGEGVDAGRGEAEDPGHQGDDQVSQRQVHLLVVEGAVHVEHVVGEPAEGEEAYEDQHDLSQTLPRLHLQDRDKETRQRKIRGDGGWVLHHFHYIHTIYMPL